MGSASAPRLYALEAALTVDERWLRVSQRLIGKPRIALKILMSMTCCWLFSSKVSLVLTNRGVEAQEQTIDAFFKTFSLFISFS